MAARIEISHGSFISDHELDQLRQLIKFSKKIILDTSSEPYSLGIEKISQEYPNLKILTGCHGQIPSHWIWYPGWLIKIDELTCIETTKDVPNTKWHLWLRRPKPERISLVEEIKLQGLLGTGEIVFPHKLVEEETKSYWPELKTFLNPWSEYKDYILNSLDIEPGLNGALYPSWELRKSRALDLISETEVTGDKIFFSEKTWKPIRAGQLFLIWGHYNSIATLRSLGFNVFDKFIDHSYDLEVDDSKRLKKCVQELKRLISLSDQEWNFMWSQTYTDRAFNQTHLRLDWKKYLEEQTKDN